MKGLRPLQEPRFLANARNDKLVGYLRQAVLKGLRLLQEPRFLANARNDRCKELFGTYLEPHVVPPAL